MSVQYLAIPKILALHPFYYLQYKDLSQASMRSWLKLKLQLGLITCSPVKTFSSLVFFFWTVLYCALTNWHMLILAIFCISELYFDNESNLLEYSSGQKFLRVIINYDLLSLDICLLCRCTQNGMLIKSTLCVKHIIYLIL